ncbi:MAG TPA: SxtJ family membrane protein [Nitrospiraceae bacterium]|nr:SxtJ family membrane protein [Nitrospiraceae bacterium]
MEQTATRKELRQFGLLVGAVFTVIGLWPLVFREEPVRLWAIGIGGLLMAGGGMLPQLLAPIHTGWMWVGHILGWINTRILLGIVFYGLVTPIGMVFRLMGKDTMRQRFAESSTTYRVVRSPRPHSHMKHQF